MELGSRLKALGSPLTEPGSQCMVEVRVLMMQHLVLMEYWMEPKNRPTEPENRSTVEKRVPMMEQLVVLGHPMEPGS